MDIGTSKQYHGNVKPSSIEQDGYDSDLFAHRYTEIPSNMQMRIDYGSRTDGQPVYQAWAPRGLAESDCVATGASSDWLIHYLEYDVNNYFIKRTIAYDAYTNRATTAVFA